MAVRRIYCRYDGDVYLSCAIDSLKGTLTRRFHIGAPDARPVSFDQVKGRLVDFLLESSDKNFTIESVLQKIQKKIPNGLNIGYHALSTYLISLVYDFNDSVFFRLEKRKRDNEVLVEYCFRRLTPSDGYEERMREMEKGLDMRDREEVLRRSL